MRNMVSSCLMLFAATMDLEDQAMTLQRKSSNRRRSLENRFGLTLTARSEISSAFLEMGGISSIVASAAPMTAA